MPHPTQPTPPVQTRDIAFECEGLPLQFTQVQEFDWCSLHHVKAGRQQHSISMMREAHTLLIFDRGSYSDGWRNVDGMRIGQRGILGTGVDVVPAGANLNAWSGLKCDVGCTLVSVNPSRLESVLGDEHAHQLRPAVNSSNELLVALASRLSAWALLQPHERNSLTLPLFRVALNPRFTRPFYAVPRTSAARTASG